MTPVVASLPLTVPVVIAIVCGVLGMVLLLLVFGTAVADWIADSRRRYRSRHRDPEWEQCYRDAMRELDVIDGTLPREDLVRTPLQPGEIDMGPDLQPHAYVRVTPQPPCTDPDCPGEHVMNMYGEVVACLAEPANLVSEQLGPYSKRRADPIGTERRTRTRRIPPRYEWIETGTKPHRHPFLADALDRTTGSGAK